MQPGLSYAQRAHNLRNAAVNGWLTTPLVAQDAYGIDSLLIVA